MSAAVATWFCDELKEERPYSRLIRPSVDSTTDGASNVVRLRFP